MKKITSRFPGLKVLLVEDYFINQEVTKDILELMDCEVDIAEDGGQGLDMVQSNAYDLIIMDLQIPVMDGLELTRQIRKMSEKGKNIPIVALTASALDGDREKCKAAGMNDYISKPTEAQQIEEILRKYFSERMTMIQ